jgi:hypothetical protein
MLIRRSAALLGLVVCLSGCAGQTSSSGSEVAAPSSSAPAPAPSSASASVSVEPSGAKPTAVGAETISGTVEAGVEPGCLLVQDAKGSHLLVFDDSAMRTDATAAVGKKVTLTGRSEPTMMSTCQQGVPFIVTSLTAA